MENISEFIDKARKMGKPDDEIRNTLNAAGWKPEVVNSELEGLSVPMPASSNNPVQSGGVSHPIAVTHMASTLGFEYSIMFISLWAAALSLGYIYF